MSSFDSILLPLDGSLQAAKAVPCALWLAERLHATLHVLHAAPHPLAPANALERLSALAAQRSRTVLHQTKVDPVQAVLEATKEHHVKLVVITARGESASRDVERGRTLGRIARALVVESSVPVLLVPLHDRSVLPWRSMLVAASGDPESDEALATAARLASALDLRVTVVHVIAEPGSGALGQYADAAYHELPWRLEEMVKRALLSSSPEDIGRIEGLAVRRGDPITEVIAEVEQRRSSVVAVGWHGDLSPEHANVLLGLLERAAFPLLVVRKPPPSEFRLKVGDEIGPRPDSTEGDHV